MIPPHGGKLVTKVIELDETRKNDIERLPCVTLSPLEEADLLLIAVGAYSPLEGFMDEESYHSVVETMLLPSGLLWSMPVVLRPSEESAHSCPMGSTVALRSGEGLILATLTVRSTFSCDKKREAMTVYGTTDERHPGVRMLYDSGDVGLGGPVQYVATPHRSVAGVTALAPTETRSMIAANGWKTVVGFQTRNPIHRAHEYLIKCAMESVDGVLIHPLVGVTKDDDIPAEVRMECYKVLIERYFPKDRVLLSPFPAGMRYAGPREAVFHAIVRKNYGCTHFIVGRDHAGVGDFYGSFDAQRIFDTIDVDRQGIEVLRFEHAYYCKECGEMVTAKVCPHDSQSRVEMSGSRVREALQRGERLPQEFTRPEVAEILRRAYQTTESVK